MSAGFGWRSQGILLRQQGHFQLFISCPLSLNSYTSSRDFCKARNTSSTRKHFSLSFFGLFLNSFSFFSDAYSSTAGCSLLWKSHSHLICIFPGAGWQPSLLIGVPVSRFKALRTAILCSGCRIEPSGGFTNNSRLQPLWKTLWHIYRSWTCISCSPKTPLLGPH